MSRLQPIDSYTSFFISPQTGDAVEYETEVYDEVINKRTGEAVKVTSLGMTGLDVFKRSLFYSKKTGNTTVREAFSNKEKSLNTKVKVNTENFTVDLPDDEPEN